MVFVSCASLTKLTWKPVPTGNPPLGGETVYVRRLPLTTAARSSWPPGRMPWFCEAPKNEAGYGVEGGSNENAPD